MSLDISLHTKDGEEVAAMNWLRNPFGLCNWAEDNYVSPNAITSQRLYFACNHWAYDNSKNINRTMFLNAATEYNEQIQALKEGFFYFDLPGYRQFVQPHMRLFPSSIPRFGNTTHIDGEQYIGDRLAIPMEHFQPIEFNIFFGEFTSLLAQYKAWMRKLIDFAVKLQDTSLEFYCSN